MFMLSSRTMSAPESTACWSCSRVSTSTSTFNAGNCVRARETAEIVAEAYAGMKVATVDELKPGKPVKSVLSWLQGQPADATVAVVGHEPQLGMLISFLLAGDRKRSFVEVRKGSACLLEFPDQVKAGGAVLQWMLKPSQLRDLAE